MSECIKRKVCINVSQKSWLDGPDDNIKKKRQFKFKQEKRVYEAVCKHV